MVHHKVGCMRILLQVSLRSNNYCKIIPNIFKRDLKLTSPLDYVESRIINIEIASCLYGMKSLKNKEDNLISLIIKELRVVSLKWCLRSLDYIESHTIKLNKINLSYRF